MAMLLALPKTKNCAGTFWDQFMWNDTFPFAKSNVIVSRLGPFWLTEASGWCGELAVQVGTWWRHIYHPADSKSCNTACLEMLGIVSRSWGGQGGGEKNSKQLINSIAWISESGKMSNWPLPKSPHIITDHVQEDMNGCDNVFTALFYALAHNVTYSSSSLQSVTT